LSSASKIVLKNTKLVLDKLAPFLYNGLVHLSTQSGAGKAPHLTSAIANKEYTLEATISLPSRDLLDNAALQLSTNADASGRRAIDKALWHLQSSIEVRSTCGGFLIASQSRANVIYRISTCDGCSCPAGASGRGCWHAAALSIIVEAQRHTRPTVAALIAAARAKVQLEDNARTDRRAAAIAAAKAFNDTVFA
jgi:hypothetical protein